MPMLPKEKQQKIREMLLESKMAIKDIAEAVGCSLATVYKTRDCMRLEGKLKEKKEGTNIPDPKRQQPRRRSKFRTPTDQSRYYISHY